MKTTTAVTLVHLFIFSVMVGGVLLAPMATASTISATVNIDPDKINLRDGPQTWRSPHVKAFIRFPKPSKKMTLDINLSTVLLDGVIPAQKAEVTKFTFKAFFDREAVENYLWLKLYHIGYVEPFKNVPVEITVTGNLYNGTPFEGSDTIFVSAK